MRSPSPLLQYLVRHSPVLPTGTYEWGRRLNARIQETRRALASVAHSHPLLHAVGEALIEIDDLAADGDRSPILSAMNRPAWALAPGSAALLGITHRSGRAICRARLAVRLQRTVNALHARIVSARERYAARLPTSTERCMAEAGLDDEALARVRLFGDVRVLRHRVDAVESLLKRLHDLLPESTAAVRVAEGAEHDGAFPADELRAALTLRLRRRAASGVSAVQRATHRALVVRHVNAIVRTVSEREVVAPVAGRPAPARDVTRLLAIRSLEPRSPFGHENEDLAVWFDALQEGTASLYGRIEEGAAWPQPIPHPAAAPEAAAHTADDYFVVPIDERHVWIADRSRFRTDAAGTTRAGSPLPALRVYGDIALGATTECQIYPASGDPAREYGLAEIDWPPLFPEFDGTPGWYRSRPGHLPRVTILAEDAGAYFARIDRKGEVERLDDAPWDECDDVRAVCVLSSRSSPTAHGPVGVASRRTSERKPHGFLGLQTDEVGTPLAHHPGAWLRTSDPYGIQPGEALESERDLFARMVLADRDLAPRFIASAQCTKTQRQGLLYAPPFAIAAAEDYAPISRWLTGDRARVVETLRAIARVLAAVHGAGYALCTAHVRAFAFVPWYGKATPTPRASLVYAPLAATLNATVGNLPAESHLNSAAYPNLRIRGAPWLQSSMVATRVTDAAAFAVLVLELCAGQPLQDNGTWLPWGELLETTDRRASVCYRAGSPRVARELAGLLAAPEKWPELLPLLDAATESTFSERLP